MLTRSFRKSPYSLMLYNSLSLSVYSVVVAGLIYFLPLQEFTQTWIYLIPLILFTPPNFAINLFGCVAFVLVYQSHGIANVPIWKMATLSTTGVLFGMASSAYMHNAAHLNFKPKWMNKVIGELCSLLQFVGYKEWKISHDIHHKYPDDIVNDPHPPGDLPYWNFVLFMKYRIVKKMEYHYYKLWGNTSKSKTIWNVTGLITFMTSLLKTVTCFILMGPVIFVYFFIPTYIVNMWVNADLGYVAHRPTAHGDWKIYDLNDKWIHKLINFVALGGYYHKTHHLKPYLVNPQKGAIRETVLNEGTSF